MAKGNDDITFGDQEDNSDKPDDGIPRELRVLRTQAYDKSVSDLVTMIEASEIRLDPDYQRNYIWDNKKASLLIESILLNVPIPVLYVEEDVDNTWNVVDGLQRLNTLRRFFANEFRLSGLEVLHELNRSQYSTLNPKAQRILRNGIIRVIVILQESHAEIKYDIFARLNRGSVRLSEQELRNCLYRGSFNTLLKRLRQDERLLACLGLEEPHKRFVDSELILRFFALHDSYDREQRKVAGYGGNMKAFLNAFMNGNRMLSEERQGEFERLFSTTMEKVHAVFEAKAFRRITPNGQADGPINRALMDVEMLSAALLPADAMLAHADEIKNLAMRLPNEDKSFDEAITYGTNLTQRLEYRINCWMDAVTAILAK